VGAEIGFIFSPNSFFVLKQSSRHAVRNHDIKQRVANRIVADNDVEKFDSSFADKLFKSEFLDNDDAVDDVVFVKSKQEIFPKSFGDKCECAHDAPCVKFEWSVGSLEYWIDG
jgi:hypothetical protein